MYVLHIHNDCHNSFEIYKQTRHVLTSSHSCCANIIKDWASDITSGYLDNHQITLHLCYISSFVIPGNRTIRGGGPYW